MSKKNNVLIFVLISVFCVLKYGNAKAIETSEFSKAGFWELKNSGREVFDFNIGWRFSKGNTENAQISEFDDSNWDVVNCPHGLELISDNASGSNNYQGPAWYRKHFSLPAKSINKNLSLHFEGVMGKCKIWLNGELIGENYGGYLPFTVNLTGKIKPGKENVIAVWADNSDDPDYPPGKSQDNLDFSYFGGIYRDVWMISTEAVHVSDAIVANKVAGGGIFTHTEKLSEKQATVVAKVDIKNDSYKTKFVNVSLELKDKNNKLVAKSIKKDPLRRISQDNWILNLSLIILIYGHHLLPICIDWK